MSVKCNNCLETTHEEDDCPHPATLDFNMWQIMNTKRISMLVSEVEGVNLGGIYRCKNQNTLELIFFVTPIQLQQSRHFSQLKLVHLSDGRETLMNLATFKNMYAEVELFCRDKGCQRA